MFLAALRRLAHALAQSHQRIDDDRRAGEADEGELGVEVDQDDEIADQREAFADQIADRFGDRLLNLLHVAGDARHQLPARAAREEAGRLAERVREQLTAHVAHHELAHVRHQERREVRADAFAQRGEDDEQADLHDAVLRQVLDQDIVENRFDQVREQSRCGAVEEHRDERRKQSAPIRSPVPKQSKEMIHAGEDASVALRYPCGWRRRHCQAVSTISLRLV